MDEDFICIYDINQKFKVVKKIPVKRYGVHDLAISRNFMATCSNDGTLRFFDLKSKLSII